MDLGIERGPESPTRITYTGLPDLYVIRPPVPNVLTASTYSLLSVVLEKESNQTTALWIYSMPSPGKLTEEILKVCESHVWEML